MATTDHGKMDGKGTRRIKTSSAAMNSTATTANIVSAPTPLRFTQWTVVPNNPAPPQRTIDIMNSCPTTLARSSPSTSVSHSDTHNPCRDQADPTQVADNGAIRQKRLSPKTELRVAWIDPVDGVMTRSGTTT
jgi:hypothetical protein